MVALLKGKVRSDLRKSTLRNLRKEGYLPAVIYGKSTNGEPLAVQGTELIKLVRDNGRNSMFSLQLDDNKYQVMISEIQRDAIKGDILHVDFHEVDMTREIETEVPVKLIGKAIGEKEGGMVSQLLHQVSVRCLPQDIPEVVEVNVSELKIGDSIKISELTDVPVTITNDPEETVVTILAQASEQEPGQEQEDATEETEEEQSS